MLRLRGLVKHFESPGEEIVRAVDGVSLDVGRGEFVALYGPSGSGKSTLLRLIAGVLKPDAGEVLVDGRDITKLKPGARADYQRLELGFVQQSLDLLPGVSAIDNAILKLIDGPMTWRESRRKVLPLLTELGMESRLKHRAEDLSMGERQRVLIARALSTDPKLVLADEPTGSLDQKRGREVFDLLVELCRSRDVAMLLATHDPRAATFATQTHTLEEGRLVSRDPDDDLLGVGG